MADVKFNTNRNFSNENIASTTTNNNLVLLQEHGKRRERSGSDQRASPEKEESFSKAEKPKVSSSFDDELHLFANPRKLNANDTTSEEEEEDDEIDLSDQKQSFEQEPDDHVNLSDSGRQDFSRPQFNAQSFAYDDTDDDDDGVEVSSDDGGSVASVEESKGDDKNYDEFPDMAPNNYKERARIKQELLLRLIRLEKSGYSASKKFNMASAYEDLLFEYRRLKKQRDIEKSIKMSRYILTSVVSGIEYVNHRWDPFHLKLDRWSENVMENINDYDEVFEELHEKYAGSVSMPPELKLIMMVAGSGFMFHLTNTLFKSATPDLNDILRNNPDIMNNISQAAMKNMTQKMGGGDNDPLANMMQQGLNMVQNNRNSAGGRPAGPPRPAPSGAQRTMNGPSGPDIDDIVNSLESNDQSPRPALVQRQMQQNGPKRINLSI
jgi:hypothetical protein